MKGSLIPLEQWVRISIFMSERSLTLYTEFQMLILFFSHSIIYYSQSYIQLYLNHNCAAYLSKPLKMISLTINLHLSIGCNVFHMAFLFPSLTVGLRGRIFIFCCLLLSSMHFKMVFPILAPQMLEIAEYARAAVSVKPLKRPSIKVRRQKLLTFLRGMSFPGLSISFS